MYHSWDSQNAWLRQIAAQNYIYINRATAATLGIKDDDWVWLISHIGKIGAQARQMDGVDANTVWTWNALGKAVGAWGLDETANESVEGFYHESSYLGMAAAECERRNNGGGKFRPDYRTSGVV